MKLYKVTNGTADWWVIADHPTEAEQKVKIHVNNTDYGFSKDRVVKSIEVIATKADDMSFVTGHFLLI
jgi:hypothetical protein